MRERRTFGEEEQVRNKPGLQDFNRVPPSAVAAMEVYVGSNTPLEYRKTACGAVVIWTKRGG